jgi:hypothetical protein
VNYRRTTYGIFFALVKRGVALLDGHSAAARITAQRKVIQVMRVSHIDLDDD